MIPAARLLVRVRLAPGSTTAELAESAGYGRDSSRGRLRELEDVGLVCAVRDGAALRWWPHHLLLSHEERIIRALSSAAGLPACLAFPGAP